MAFNNKEPVARTNVQDNLVLTLLSGLKSGAMLLGDRGFDADWIRALVSQYGAWANIPPRRNRKEPICFSPHLYRARNMVERFFNKKNNAAVSHLATTNSRPTTSLSYSLHPWRIYPTVVKLDGVKTPVDWLRRFADVYGFEIEVDGKKGHFFLLAQGPIPDKLTFQQPIGKKRKPELKAQISRFTDQDPITNRETAAFIVAIDVEKYLQTLKELGVRRDDIMERFVPAPQARD